MWISKKYMKKLENAEKAAYPSPVPTQMVSNGEYMPLAQTKAQREVEERIKLLADAHGKKLGLNRRPFLQTSSGMAAAFLAMNDVFGSLFQVEAAEAADPAAAAKHRANLAGEFVFDVQTHHVRSDYAGKDLLFLSEWAQGKNPQKKVINPKLGAKSVTLDRWKFDHYIKDIFLDSDTNVAILRVNSEGSAISGFLLQ